MDIVADRAGWMYNL